MRQYSKFYLYHVSTLYLYASTITQYLYQTTSIRLLIKDQHIFIQRQLKLRSSQESSPYLLNFNQMLLPTELLDDIYPIDIVSISG